MKFMHVGREVRTPTNLLGKLIHVHRVTMPQPEMEHVTLQELCQVRMHITGRVETWLGVQLVLV